MNGEAKSFGAALGAQIAADRHDVRLLAFIAVYVGVAAVLAARYGLDWPILAMLGSYWVYMAIAIFALSPVLMLIVARRDPVERRRLAATYLLRGALFLAFIPFLAAFSQIKSVLYLIMPYDLDLEFTWLDQWMHFGVDPWAVYWPVLDWMPFTQGSTFYHGIWAAPMLLGPALAISLDRNLARRRRAVLTYLFVWVGLGNVFAALGYTVGPIYHDDLLGDPARFAGLEASLAATDFDQTMFRASVDYLLAQRMTGVATTGAGIAAFPSVHVGMAVLTALYLGALSRWLILPGIAYVLIIQLFSVLCGLHYAADGYFSLIAVPLFWVWAGRRMQSPVSGEARISQPVPPPV